MCIANKKHSDLAFYVGPNELDAVYFPRLPRGRCTPPKRYIGQFRFIKAPVQEIGTVLLGSR